MRLIDADDLIYLYFDDGSGNKTFSFVPGELIEKAPTVDAVEVVRCKHCKHWKKAKDFKGKLCLMHDAVVMEDGFCSYGERRTNETNK